MKCKFHWSLRSGPWKCQQKKIAQFWFSSFFFSFSSQSRSTFLSGWLSFALCSVSKQQNKQPFLICCRCVPHCRQAGMFSLPFYKTPESDCQRASNSAGAEFTRGINQSIAPDILSVFSHRGCRDRNVQKSDDKLTNQAGWTGGLHAERWEKKHLSVVLLQCAHRVRYVYSSRTKASNHPSCMSELRPSG